MAAFDVLDGTIHLDSGTVLEPRTPSADLDKLGVELIRTVDLSSGWKVSTSSPQPIGGNDSWISFWMRDGVVRKVGIVFTDLQMQKPREQQASYKSFLVSQLGQPSEMRFEEQIVLYKYQWGSIQAMYDPRNGTSAITVGWI